MVLKGLHRFLIGPTHQKEKDENIRDEKYEEILAAIIVNNFAKFNLYFPYTNSSISFPSLVYILNDISVNSRCSVVEFGSGYSTLVIAKLLAGGEKSSRIISIEEDKQWADKMQRVIARENLSDIAKVVHSPVSNADSDSSRHGWYDREQINRALEDMQFDCAIIDGPTAWKPEWAMRRYGAGPFLKNRLGSEFTIFLDDADRPGEQKILRSWKLEFGWDFEMISTTLARCVKGQSGNILW